MSSMDLISKKFTLRKCSIGTTSFMTCVMKNICLKFQNLEEIISECLTTSKYQALLLLIRSKNLAFSGDGTKSWK